MSQSSDVKKYNQYFSSRPSINIMMTNGQRIRFVGGVYMTEHPDEIAFLDAEIRAGNNMIMVKKGQEQIDSDALDPLAAIKKKAIEDYIAQQALAANPNRDMGSTVQSGAGADMSIATTKTLAPIIAGSKSGASK